MSQSRALPFRDAGADRAGGAPSGADDGWNARIRAASPLLAAFFGRRIGHGQADLDDLVQESLIAAYLHRTRYDHNRPFHAWLFGIARHKLADYRRTQKPHSSLQSLDESLAVRDFEPAATARLDVERLLRMLPAKQANVIRDMHLIGLSSAEASSLRAISEADVRVSVHRGVKAMRRHAGAC